MMSIQNATGQVAAHMRGARMSDYTTSIGLDVHARSIKACAFNPCTGEVWRKSFGYDPGSVADWALSFERPKAVYESGVTGFHLCRELRALGVDCVIGAVSKMMKPAADKHMKTDRKDAQFLAKQLAMHEIHEVHVPDSECEAARDLSRALADARDDVTAAKQRLSKFLLRHGHCYPSKSEDGKPQKSWTRAHWAWIRSIKMEEPAAAATLDYYIDRVERAIEEKSGLETRIKALAEEPRWKPTVDALRCFKGIEVMTAMSLACEVDGFSRFRNASAFSCWLGITPSENSSGERSRRGGITKAGNKHLRKNLAESAWHFANATRHPKDLAKGQVVNPAVRRHALKGNRRLIERRRALDGAGKKSVVANMAIARELACWCWAVGCMVEAES